MSLLDAVVITGAGRGIGRSIALDFGKSKIPLLCISKTETVELTKKEIQKYGGIVESKIIDIGDFKVTEEALSDWIARKNYKRLGVVLASGILGPNGPLEGNGNSHFLAEWDECHKVNVLGNLAVLRALLPRMLENKFGRIITFSGGGAAYANPTFPAYSATKTAMVRITENIHEDLKSKGDFAIVCLAPGAIETDMLKQVRMHGGEVKTTVNISEPVNFVRSFIECNSCNFSGCLVHVRNNWKDYLNSTKQLENESVWKLRRVD